ncbi:MAG: hypothetical protein IPP40_17475 [bacterium]|nr:hypothetical protein [bacterium]
MKQRVLLSLLCLFAAISANAQVRLITTVEYQVDNGSFTSYNVTDAASVNWADVVPTTGLQNGLHRLRVRGTDDQGRIAQVTDAFFGTISNDFSGQTRVITDLDYQIDGASFTNVNPADAASVNWADMLPTTGLPNGLHRVRVRGRDSGGRTGVVTDGFFATISNDFSGQTRLATLAEYRVDGGSYSQINPADAPIINVGQIISTNSLAIGLHSIDFRGVDDLNRTGQIMRALVIVTSPFVVGQQRTIVAAEVWFGNDPGVGNGISIPLPVDGAFNENSEDVVHIFTNQPVGYYTFGYRGLDDAGRWSSAVIDSVLVGPILVISPSGNDVILNWQFPDGIDQYYVERAPQATGPYAVIDSTTNRTYTHVGIISTQDRGFYQVSFRDDSVTLQQPTGVPARR